MCICTRKQKIACDLQLCNNIYLEMCISLFIIGPIYAQSYWGGHCCPWLVTTWTMWFYTLDQPEITVSWKSRVNWWLLSLQVAPLTLPVGPDSEIYCGWDQQGPRSSAQHFSGIPCLQHLPQWWQNHGELPELAVRRSHRPQFQLPEAD